MERRERFYAVLLKDGTADWRYAQPSGRVDDAIQGSWRATFAEIRAFIDAHNQALVERARREDASQPEPSLFT